MIEKNTEVFLPIKFNTYKLNKINLLKTQMKAVSTLDRIKKIKELEKIKNEQRKLLKSTLKDLKQHYSKIKKLLPTNKEVKIQEKTITKSRISNINTDNLSEYRVKKQSRSKIDEELAKIQEKIRNINL